MDCWSIYILPFAKSSVNSFNMDILLTYLPLFVGFCRIGLLGPNGFRNNFVVDFYARLRYSDYIKNKEGLINEKEDR